MTEAAKKAWRTRRARKAAKTRKESVLHSQRSKVAKKEVAWRKRVQALAAPYLMAWWKREYLDGSRPRKCEVCGETEKLGLAIHHIDPKIEKGHKNYNLSKNKAPLCGTCHNIITYKKTSNFDEIIEVLKSRHKKALKNGLLP